MSKSKVVSIMLVLSLVLSSALLSYATSSNGVIQTQHIALKTDVNLYWDNTSDVDVSLVLSGSRLTAMSNIISYKPSESIYGRICIQKYMSGRWITLKDWRISGTGVLDATKIYQASAGKYRSKVSVKVGGEQITKYSSSVTVK